MKTKIAILCLILGVSLSVLSKGGSSTSSSVSAVGSHAANNGGFSQPPVTVSSGETSANATTSDSATASTGSGGSASTTDTGGSGQRPSPDPDDASFPGYSQPNTNTTPDSAQNWSDILVITNSDGSMTNLYPHMNADGDSTNQNGTMTYDTSKPHWWVKTD